MSLNQFQPHFDWLVAYKGHSLLMLNNQARLDDSVNGYYYRKTRFLSDLKLTLNGEEPHFVSGNPVENYSIISYYLAEAPGGGSAGSQPDNPKSHGGGIVGKGLVLQVNHFLGRGWHVDFILTNHTLKEATFEFVVGLEADFADQKEAGQGEREQFAEITREWTPAKDGGTLTFRYLHPHLPHATEVCLAGAPGPVSEQDGELRIGLTLPPQQPLHMSLDICPVFLGKRLKPLYEGGTFQAESAWDRVCKTWKEKCLVLETPVPWIQAAWDRAVEDIASLFLFDGEEDEIYTPAAGIPIFQAYFGRDTLVTGLLTALLNPDTLRGVLLKATEQMGREYQPKFDEQPGRIMHQQQFGPLALLEKEPFLHYYGDALGPSLYLIGVAAHLAITGDRDFFNQTRKAVESCLAWFQRDADLDGDGFFEYKTDAGEWGTKNQGWKDSNDAILYPDGRRVENPLALLEIQAYARSAIWQMGLAFRQMGDEQRGRELLDWGKRLQKRLNEAFWMPEANSFAIALDSQKRQVGGIASNIGHCMTAGGVTRERAEALVKHLFSPEMFSGWGIRTISTAHPAYNPLSYHLGTVWPPENAVIALGLKRYGFIEELHALNKGLLDLTRIFAYNRLPEAVGGYPRDDAHPHPGIYPLANSPQAWSAATIIYIIQMMLGMVPFAPQHTLYVDPTLPEWLPEVTVRQVPCGSERASLRFWRDASGCSHFEVLETSGNLKVEQKPLGDLERQGIWGNI